MYHNKRLITIFIFIFAFMGSFGGSVREAKSIAIADDLLILGAALVTAGGYTLLTNDGARASATQFIQSIPLRLKAKMELCIAAAQTVFYIDSQDWTDIQTGIGAIKDGAVSVSQPGIPYEFATVKGDWVQQNYVVPFYGALTISISHFEYAGNNDQVNINTTIGATTAYIKIQKTWFDNHYEYRAIVQCPSGSTVWAGPYGLDSVVSVPYVTYGAYADYANLIVGGAQVWTSPVDSKLEGFWYWGSISASTLMTGSGVGIEEVEIMQALGDTYNVTNNYNNPAWDASNQAVTVPTSWDETVNRTPEEVIAAAGSLLPPGTVDPTTTTDSWLQSVYNGIAGVKSSVQGLTGAVTSFFDPTLPVSFEPLKIVGVSFTNKFPFSLPWDILRSFQSLVGVDSWTGKIPIAAHSVLVNFDFEIDFSMFAGILPVVKLFELVAFDIGLVLATRKLMGGGV